MSSFFLNPKLPKDKKKKSFKSKKTVLVKRQAAPGKSGDHRPKKKKKLDEDIPSDSGSDIEETGENDGMFSQLMEGAVEQETAQEKRLRLAKEYLTKLEDEERELTEDKSIDRDAIAHRLRQEVLESSGRLMKTVADSYQQTGPDDVRYHRGHKLALTCVAVDNKHIYTGSKDCSIVKWELATGRKLCIISGDRRSARASAKDGPVGHTGHVMALAVSSDGKFLASGGVDRVLRIWDAETCGHLHTFKGHRDTVTGLVFQKDTHQLFSCSSDRTLKLWNIDEMSYIETLFGHQDPVSGMDCLARERPISSGGFDKTVRVWKIVEESQLVYQGHHASIDCIKLINEEFFVSGSQDGMVALWSMAKKKPLVYQKHNSTSNNAGTCVCDTWVSSVTALPYSDLIASGSSDGFIQIWKCTPKESSLESLFSIPVLGCVNHMTFSPCGNYLVAAVGRDHKFGRWWCDNTAKDRLVVVHLTRKQ